jgi:hypothetical protein
MRKREWVSGEQVGKDELGFWRGRRELEQRGAASSATARTWRRMVTWGMVFLGAVLFAGCHPGKSGGGAGGNGASGGGADGVRVNFAEVAKSPDARTAPVATQPVFDIGPGPALPAHGTADRRKEAARAAAEALPIRPCNVSAAVFGCPFDGVAQDNCKSCVLPPPDPNAAAGAGKIVEVVNQLIQVTNRVGTVDCGGPVTLQRLLRTTNTLTDPRVQFDNVNQRFSFSITVSNPAANDMPRMFVAATATEDPCGEWYVYDMTFHGDAVPAGTFLDFPMLGQDRNALLLSLRNCPKTQCGNANFMVFGVPKALVYANKHVEFDCFTVDSLTAPVTNAGQPMIDSAVSFFLAAVPGTGYKLYKLTKSGGSGAQISKTTINAPFSVPPVVKQPGTSATLDSSDGNIVSFPYFDGTRIWFSHDADDDGFPTVLYGFVDTSKNTVERTFAFHSGSSDDFNSSLAVGITQGGETVYMNWAFTDTKAQTGTTAVFASGDASKPLVTIAGAGTPFTSGGGVDTACPTDKPCRFGDFSSVSVDPTVSGCAFATQQYFATDGSWKTRITPIGQCENVVK